MHKKDQYARREIGRRRWLWATASAVTAAAIVGGVVATAPNIGHAAESVVLAVSSAGETATVTVVPTYEAFNVEWAPVQGANSYNFVVARDAQMTDVIWSEVVAEPAARVENLKNGNEYFFQVRSFNALGAAGEVTAPESVTTKFRPVTAPALVVVAAESPTSVRLHWHATKWATGYTVTRSAKRDMSDGVSYNVSDTTAVIDGLPVENRGRDYYFTVQATNGGHRSPPSKVVAGTTLPTTPQDASISASSPLGVTVSWQAAQNVRGYVVERSTTEDFANVEKSYKVPAAYNRLSVNDLKPGQKAYFRVHAVNGDATGESSALVAGTASTAKAFTVRAGTYNVVSTRYDTANAYPWSQRRTQVSGMINAAKLDVVGLQEATGNRVSHTIPRTQVEDLAALTKPRLTLSKAGYLGTRILYDATKYKPGVYGVVTLPPFPNDTTRAAVWQVLEDKKTHGRFLVVNTHLTNAPGSSRDTAREAQAEEIAKKLQSINRDNLPVIITGDLNSFDERAAVTPMSVLAAHGYTDADHSAAKKTNDDYNSLSRFAGTERRETGAKLDHILTSGSVGVSHFEVMLDVDSRGRLKASEASDHRPLIAELRVPVVK